MMSDSVDVREPKKKSYTEKDFFVLMTIELSRMFVNKEKSHQRIWGDPPKEWDQDKLGPWRSPTGKCKDTLPILQKKCEFLLDNMPEEKREKANELKALITEVKLNRGFAHSVVSCLHFRDQIIEFIQVLSTPNNAKEPNPILQEIKDKLIEGKSKIEMIQKGNKRSLSDDETHYQKEIKKPKRASCASSNKNETNVHKKQLRPIKPKLSDSQLFSQEGVQSSTVLSCSMINIQSASSNSFPPQFHPHSQTATNADIVLNHYAHKSPLPNNKCVSIPYISEMNQQNETKKVYLHSHENKDYLQKEQFTTSEAKTSEDAINCLKNPHNQLFSTDSSQIFDDPLKPITIEFQENRQDQHSSCNIDNNQNSDQYLDLNELLSFTHSHENTSSQMSSPDSGLSLAGSLEPMDDEEYFDHQNVPAERDVYGISLGDKENTDYQILQTETNDYLADPSNFENLDVSISSPGTSLNGVELSNYGSPSLWDESNYSGKDLDDFFNSLWQKKFASPGPIRNNSEPLTQTESEEVISSSVIDELFDLEKAIDCM